MEFLPNLLTLAGMHLLMAMLPGPNTMVVSWLSATSSRADGLLATGGVVVATLLWVTVSLWGFGALLTQAGWLYGVLRLLGAAYLIAFGLRVFLAGWRRPSPNMAAPTPPPGRRGGPFRMGLLTTLSNPKSAVFWTSAFLVAVPPHAPLWVHAAIMGIIALQTALWYGAVALLLSTGLARRCYLRLARVLDVVTGAVMVALGLRLAEEVRREIAMRAAV